MSDICPLVKAGHSTEDRILVANIGVAFLGGQGGGGGGFYDPKITLVAVEGSPNLVDPIFSQQHGSRYRTVFQPKQEFNQNSCLAEQMLLFLQQQEAVEQDRLIPVMELTKTGINVVQIKVCTYLLCS